MVPYKIYQCDQCDNKIEESSSWHKDNGKDYCLDCAFKNGLIKSSHYLDMIGFCSGIFEAGINPDTKAIAVWYKERIAPWMKTPKQQRRSPEYTNWRDGVFKRDSYTCQECGQIGGNLNAHHIESYAKYKKLRFVQSNGITLCEKCHRENHKKKVGQIV